MERHSAPDDPLAHQIALSLGVFSIGLGMAELFAPRAIARLAGINESPHTASIIRAFGAREIGAGVAVLTQPGRAMPLWSRAAGDALDLAYLGAALQDERADQRRTAAATAAVLGVTMLDVLCAQRLGRGGERGDASPDERQRNVHVQRSVTVNRPVEQVFAFWRRLENLPRFMHHLHSVQTLDATRSHWQAKGPAGVPFAWDAEIVEERDQESIAWRSLPGSRLENRGTVRFQPAPGARGTEVHVELEYRPPAGTFGRTVGWLFGRNPEQQLREDLRRFKQLLETGEIPLSDGPGLWRAAQPPAKPERLKTLAGVQP